MQEYLTAWINWYYGDGEYPSDLQSKLTHEEQMEAISKTAQIKKIIETLKEKK
jgi:hypothetical protein